MLGTVAVLVGAAFLVSSLSWLGETNSSTTSYRGVARLDLDLDNATVDFIAGGNEVVVEQKVTTSFFGGEARIVEDGDVLELVLNCPGIGIGCKGTYSVTAPAATELSGDTGNGTITIRAIEAPIDVTTSNGDIRLEEVAASVKASTSNGDITGTGLAAETLDVTTSNGGISLDFAQAPASVTARTSNGDIDLAVPDEAPAYAVSTSTSHGSVNNAIKTDPDAEGSISLRTSNGDIQLRRQLLTRKYEDGQP
ncbi:MAG: DUF4097 family beta strand repeat-containing protein [Acidimicrobiia bacterium]